MESIRSIHDSLLVREAQGGDHAAFAQLVHAHDEAVLKLALRITGSQSDAQDIYQEAFLKVYKKLDCFRLRVLRLHLDLPHRHQRLPGSPAEESKSERE